jgi:hypothetical protein
MKTYIKPNTEIHTVELEQMIAESLSVSINKTGDAVSAGDAAGKDFNVYPEKLWEGSDEEEE